jgi:hypothetical protein
LAVWLGIGGIRRDRGRRRSFAHLRAADRRLALGRNIGKLPGAVFIDPVVHFICGGSGREQQYGCQQQQAHHLVRFHGSSSFRYHEDPAMLVCCVHIVGSPLKSLNPLMPGNGNGFFSEDGILPNSMMCASCLFRRWWVRHYGNSPVNEERPQFVPEIAAEDKKTRQEQEVAAQGV